MKNIKYFKLIHGELRIDNSTLKIKYKKLKYGLDILKIFGSVSIISLFITKVKNYENIIGIYENTKFWLFGIAAVILLYLFIFSLFKEIWIHSTEINDLIKVEIDENYNEDENHVDEDNKIEITFYKNNGRKKAVFLQKKGNKLDLLLEVIKKRNTRIQIEHIDEGV